MTDQCGTDAGYHRHRRSGEQPCGRCRHAHTVAVRDSRARRSAASGRRITVPEQLLAALYLHTTIEQQVAAEDTLGRTTIDRLVHAYDRGTA